MIFLKKGGEKERVTRFFDKYLKQDPKNAELHRRYAKFLFEQGNYKKAASEAKKSLAGSYDQNEIFAATVYADSLHKLGQDKQARTFLQKYQARTDLTPKSREQIEEKLSQLK